VVLIAAVVVAMEVTDVVKVTVVVRVNCCCCGCGSYLNNKNILFRWLKIALTNHPFEVVNEMKSDFYQISSLDTNL
jgi:hypothetical protein